MFSAHITYKYCSFPAGTALFVFVGCSAGSSMDMGDGRNNVERGARIASIGKLLQISSSTC